MRDFPWFGLVVTVVVATVLGGIIGLIYASVDSYRRQCHDVGGHIISVRDNEICVDRDNKVIFL